MTLRPLPQNPYEYVEWKNEIRQHPDCYVSIEGAYYSAPYIHRGKKLRVKISQKQIEIFLEQERVALHPRNKCKLNCYITILDHLPPNSRAYHEATPQWLLSEAKGIHPDLYLIVEGLFKENTIANLRRVQGLNRTAKKEIHNFGFEKISSNISRACTMMSQVSKIKVPYFKELLICFRKESVKTQDRDITRKPNNPMIRNKTEQLNLFINEGEMNGNIAN